MPDSPIDTHTEFDFRTETKSTKLKETKIIGKVKK